MKILLRGCPASPGKIKGRVKVFKKEKTNNNQFIRVNKGEIIVIPYITPFDFPIIIDAGAIITDYGGVTSHAAIIARELGIPCIVNTGNATSLLKNDMEIIVDGDEGIVYGEK